MMPCKPKFHAPHHLIYRKTRVYKLFGHQYVYLRRVDRLRIWSSLEDSAPTWEPPRHQVCNRYLKRNCLVSSLEQPILKEPASLYTIGPPLDMRYAQCAYC